MRRLPKAKTIETDFSGRLSAQSDQFSAISAILGKRLFWGDFRKSVSSD
jgi:hypothetical protein